MSHACDRRLRPFLFLFSFFFFKKPRQLYSINSFQGIRIFESSKPPRESLRVCANPHELLPLPVAHWFVSLYTLIWNGKVIHFVVNTECGLNFSQKGETFIFLSRRSGSLRNDWFVSFTANLHSREIWTPWQLLLHQWPWRDGEMMSELSSPADPAGGCYEGIRSCDWNVKWNDLCSSGHLNQRM